MNHMMIVHGRRKKAPLPTKAAPPSLPIIDGFSILLMGFFHSSSQRPFCRWDRDKVNMIRHQAIGKYIDIKLATSSRHELYVTAIIVIAKERPLTPIAALGFTKPPKKPFLADYVLLSHRASPPPTAAEKTGRHLQPSNQHTHFLPFET